VSGSKIACVLSSGGSRGTYQLGVLKAMKEKGIVFDLMVGASAGAANAARYVADQVDMCIHIWLEHCSDRRSINPYRLLWPWHKRPAMDLDYMFGDAIAGHEIDMDAIAASPTDVYVAVCAYPELRTEYRRLDVDSLFATLIASCAAPYVYNKHVYLDGRRYVDGGLVDPIPLGPALDSDCDTIYVLEVRSEEEIELMRQKGAIARGLYGFMNPMQRALVDRRGVRAHMHDALTDGGFRDMSKKIIFVRPYKPLPVGRLSIDKDAMSETVDIGYRDGRAFI
jgi:predicted patatin/cPLA2 family phospholipase